MALLVTFPGDRNAPLGGLAQLARLDLDELVARINGVLLRTVLRSNPCPVAPRLGEVRLRTPPAVARLDAVPAGQLSGARQLRGRGRRRGLTGGVRHAQAHHKKGGGDRAKRSRGRYCHHHRVMMKSLEVIERGVRSMVVQ